MPVFGDCPRTSKRKLARTIVFGSKAAKGRRKTEEEIHEIAQGRIWTGKQAKEIGLVDELGGLDVAIAFAKKRIGLSAGDDVDIIELPKPKTFFEILMEDIDIDARVQITQSLSIPVSLARSLPNFYWIQLLAQEPVAVVLPFNVIVR